MPFRWRPDGDFVPDVPATRRIMPLIMRNRNESIVFFEQKINTQKTWMFLNALREKGLRVTILHLLIWAAAQTFHRRPRLNRFTAGGRIFQRRGIWISFSAKKGKTDNDPIVVIKKRIDPAWRLEEIVEKIESGIQEGRSEKRSATDVELSLVFKLPVFVQNFLAKLLMKFNHLGLLPRAFIEHDEMFASMFIANLGSIDMEAGFHHLFEYGNIPIFLTVGKNQNEVVVNSQGGVSVEPRMTLRYSFDERVEDGLYCLQALEVFKAILEDPEAYMT